MTKYYIDGPYRCIHCFQLRMQVSDRCYCDYCEENTKSPNSNSKPESQIEKRPIIEEDDSDNSIISIISRIFKLLQIPN